MDERNEKANSALKELSNIFITAPLEKCPVLLESRCAMKIRRCQGPLFCCPRSAMRMDHWGHVRWREAAVLRGARWLFK